MSCWRRSIRQSRVDGGFSTTELLVGTLLTMLAITATSGFFLASNHQIRFQLHGMETSQAARSVIDLIVRDLRMSGACLPTSGQFIALEGADAGERDEIVTRTGLVQPTSCVQTSLRQSLATGSQTLYVDRIDGFEAGMRVYVRNASGEGELVEVASVDATDRTLTADRALAAHYPRTSGVYAVKERRFWISDESSPPGSGPQLMRQVDEGDPAPFAAGVEQLDLKYQLRRNCPPCDTVDLPEGEQEWSLVEQVFVTVTARSDKTDSEGAHYRQTRSLGVKPRNLAPR